MLQRKVQRMSKLTVKKIESLIKNRIFGRHSDGNQLYFKSSMNCQGANSSLKIS